MLLIQICGINWLGAQLHSDSTTALGHATDNDDSDDDTNILCDIKIAKRRKYFFLE